jgi:hypothetical protein
MDAKFCCLPLPGKDFLPSDRKTATVAHLAEQAKPNSTLWSRCASMPHSRMSVL